MDLHDEWLSSTRKYIKFDKIEKPVKRSIVFGTGLWT